MAPRWLEWLLATPSEDREKRSGREAVDYADRVRSLGEEFRSINSLPWAQGGPLGSSTPSQERALRLAPVYAACNIISKSISSLPLHAYRQMAGDERTQMPSLPQLFQQPSSVGTLWDWLYRLLTSLTLTGNAYGLITQRDGFGFPTMIEWLKPSDVTIVDSLSEGRGSFVDPIFRWMGVSVPSEQIVHIPWFTVAGHVKGLSPIGAFATALDTGLSAQIYGKNWFDSGGVPPGTFRNTAQTVTDEDADRIKERLVKSIQSGKPIVYGADWEYGPIAIPPGDSRFVEATQMSANQIAMVYDIPPERIGGNTGGSQRYSSPEADSIQVLQHTLLPYISKLEAVFSRILPERQYVKFSADYLIRTDLATRHRVYLMDRQMGLKSINELRQLEDLPPIPANKGGDDPTSLLLQIAQGGPSAPAPAKPPQEKPPAGPQGQQQPPQGAQDNAPGRPPGTPAAANGQQRSDPELDTLEQAVVAAVGRGDIERAEALKEAIKVLKEATEEPPERLFGPSALAALEEKNGHH